ncbi:MAG: head-tail connector protein [Planctomycetota bacterium]|jgi:uncharacterized phiE125 gp8 family phage protein
MPTQVTTPPTSEPLTTAEAKLHLRVTHSEEDTYIDGLIKAARQYVERKAWLSLITQTLTLTLREFPRGSAPIFLPCAPVQSVTSISYVDTAGDPQTLTTHQTDLAISPPQIVPAYSESWPATRKQPAAVTVVYQAGFGAAATDVPQTVRQAMLLLIGDWYHYREDEPRPKVARAVDALLNLEHERDERLAEFVG